MPQDLYKLPNGWEWKSFLDVVSTKGFSVGKVKTKEYGQGGNVPIIDQSKSFIAGYCDSDNGFKGELPVIVYGDHTNNIKYIDFKFICGADGTKVLAPKKNIRPKYLFYAIHRFGPETQGYRRHFPILKQQQIPLPPLGEQERIVEKLDALFSRIDAATARLNQILTHSQALFASAMDEVFQEVGEKNGFQTLENLTSKIGSGATPRGGQKAYKEEGISLIRSLNVYDAEFRKKRLAFIDQQQADKLSNVVVQEGDVLLNITGASIARCCVAPSKYLPARVNQHVCILRPKSSLDSIYLNYLIISPKFKNDLLFQGAGGATRQALTKTMINNLTVPLPPLEEQHRIVEHLDGLSSRIQTLEKTTRTRLDHLAALKASLLDAAFRGQL